MAKRPGLSRTVAGRDLLGRWLYGSEPAEFASAFGLLLMIAGGFGILMLGKWFARNDIAWLSGVIADALGSPRDAMAPVRGAGAPLDAHAVPPTLKGAALFFGASGVMELVAGLAGPHLLPIAFLLFSVVGACIALAIWGRWWYAQRKHFLWS